MNNKNSIAGNYIYNLLYHLSQFIAPFITMPYLTRILGANNLGIFGFAHSVIAYIILICLMGSSLYGQREIAYKSATIKERRIAFFEIMHFRVVTSFIIIPIVVLLFYILRVELIYYVLMIEVLANVLDVSWFFQGMQDYKSVFLRGILIKIVGVISVFVFVKKSTDLIAYALCYTLAILFGNLMCWFKVITYVGKSKIIITKSYITMLKPIAFLFVPQIAIDVYTILDKTMLGILGSAMSDVGYYEQAQNFTRAGVRVITALGSVMLSYNSVEFANGKTKNVYISTYKSLRFSIVVGIGIVALIQTVSAIFIPVYLGKDFTKTGNILKALSPVVLFIGMSNVIGVQCFLALKRQTEYTISVIIGAITNVFLNLCLIPTFSVYGAVIASVISELSVVVYQFTQVSSEIDVKRTVLHFCICSICAFAAVVLSDLIHLETFFLTVIVVRVGICVGVYAMLLFLYYNALSKILKQKRL